MFIRAVWTLDRLIRLINNHTGKGLMSIAISGYWTLRFDPFIRLGNKTPFILSLCFISKYTIISANISAYHFLHTID